MSYLKKAALTNCAARKTARTKKGGMLNKGELYIHMYL